VSGDTRLRRALGLFETAGVSVAMMAPTAAMALNGALAASYARAAVPLAFVLAFATIGCVAFAFVTFARVYASPASVGTFNARGLGPFAGRLSGWALLLVYVLFAAGSAAEFGAFAAAACAYAGASIGWVPLALACLAVTAYVGTRPARTSSRAMLVVEGISVAAVVALCITIVARGGAHGNTLAPFSPSGGSLGGLGLATVFALLSFAGFEGAAVLGAESLEPTRTIPRALVASVALAGVLYVFVAYAQTIGFGIDAAGSAAFAASASPLGDLASRYANAAAAALVMGGAAISALAATLAAATGASRLVFSMANDAVLPERLGRVDATSGTPMAAYLTVIAISAVIVTGFALARASGTDAFAACGTIGVLALILIYGSVQVAALRLFAARWNLAQRFVPAIALVSLAATFTANVVPSAGGAPALYSVLVAAWLVLGAWIVRPRASRDAAAASEPAEPSR
jgi:amino acid transporter